MKNYNRDFLIMLKTFVVMYAFTIPSKIKIISI